MNWQPMETCPLKKYASTLDVFLVSDGNDVNVVTADYHGGSYHPSRNVPKWMLFPYDLEGFDPDDPDYYGVYNLIDETGHEDERYGKPNIGYIPTHWMPLPKPPTDTKLTQGGGKSA